MKLIRLASVLLLILGAGLVNAGVVVHDLRVKEQIGNFKPQPDTSAKQIIVQ